MNKLRLGFTETTLLFFYYLDQKKINNAKYIELQSSLINWLCTTSGFYDKKINGSYFNFNANEIKNSEIYKKYFNKLLTITKQNNCFLELCFHQIDNNIISLKEDFLKSINYYEKLSPTSLFDFLENKHILIINNLGSLMKKQFENGNVNKIHKNFPNNIKSINYFENGYSFFNNGPDNSILDSFSKICEKINKFSFDGAIISAGAYSCLIADFIINNLQKKAFIIGGELNSVFGIKCKRKNLSDMENQQYLISVPKEMKPDGYEKIEEGCYW